MKCELAPFYVTFCIERNNIVGWLYVDFRQQKTNQMVSQETLHETDNAK